MIKSKNPSDALGGYLSGCRDAVFGHIRSYLGRRTAALPPSMRRCVCDYPYRRGKALRPALVMLFSDAFGGPRGRALKVAATYQLLEDWGLGRDDLLDGGLMRRGRPSLHELYGVPKAVNALDMLHDCVSDMLYSYCGLPAAAYRGAQRLFAEATEVTLGGQHLDIEAREVPLEKFTPARYLNIARRKTAFYTCAAPCLIGAALAGRRSAAPAILRFALPLGTAFQIIDDVLDAENDGKGEFGKAPGNDIREGKRTLLAALAYRRLPAAQARELAGFYSAEASRRTPARVRRVRDLLLRSGAAADCRDRAAALTRAALASFETELLPRMRRPYGMLTSELMRELLGRKR
jgi:geranylgeranyl diphosphate synthase type II